MNKTIVFHCDCCGLAVNPQITEDCPRCQYPVNLEKEALFLESSIHDLQRVSAHGGGSLKVDELIRRYQSRLFSVRRYKASLTSPVPSDVKVQARIEPAIPTLTTSGVPQGMKVAAPPVLQQKPQPEKPAVTPPPLPPQPPRRVFSWKEFFADQVINIIASVGAFLLLIGSLSFTITTSNLLVAFLVLFGVHATFGVTGFVTYRFQTFRFVATIYSVIFALLVPLVAFSLYKVFIGNNVHFSVPVLVAIAATYAAVIYVLMAVYQRFIPFAYLGLVALLVADLALADALDLNYWWWPSMAMILALPATVSLKRGDDKLPFADHWKVLRDPIRFVMYLIVAASILSLSYMLVYSLKIDASGSPVSELRFSIVCLMLLVLLWTTLSIWLAQLTRLVIVLAFLVLASVMALCYALRFEAIGYALAFTGVALVYHGLNRFAGRRLASFGVLSLGLDCIALALVIAVPFICSPLLIIQLYASVYGTSILSTSLLYQASWQIAAELIAVGIGIFLTLSITFYRAGWSQTPLKPAWCWLLLLAGFLLNWAYSLIALTFNITPVWAFLGLALVFVAGALMVRRLYGFAWSNPLDVLAFLEILLTLSLSLSQNQDVISSLLLFFATLLYAVILFQNRQSLLFLSFIFALLALPTLSNRPLVMLTLGVFLPFASVAIHRFITLARIDTKSQPVTAETLLSMWEWPLLSVGLIYGIAFSSLAYSHGMGALQHSFDVHIPFAIEIATLSVTWYASAALARVKWWLFPSVGFAIAALLVPANSFWILLVLTPCIAFIGLAVGRSTDRLWSLPYYIVAVTSAVITGYTGYVQDHVLVTSYALLGFAILAYIIGIIEKDEIALWLLTAFTLWSVMYSTVFLGDQYRLPIVALVCAALGVSIKFFRLEPIPFFGTMPKNKFLAYALPFYATALPAAILTGVYGMLGNINSPFYGAIPDALLIYALVAFAVLLFESQPGWVWLVAVFAIWGTYLGYSLTPWYLFGVALIMALLGLNVGHVSKGMMRSSSEQDVVKSLKHFTWSWPFYATSIAAAVLIGIHGTAGSINTPFYSAIPDALLIYALLVFAILVIERQSVWLWLTACFAIWGTLLALGLNAYFVSGIAIVTALLGLAIGILSKQMIPSTILAKSLKPLRQFTWSWPWYVTAAVSAVCLGVWPTLPLQQPVIGFIGYCMLAFTIITIVILLIERIPELLVFPVGLAAATLWLWGTPPLDLVPLMIAYSLLCLVVFTSQFIWRIIPPASYWIPPAIPHAVLALGGQAVVVWSIISQGGLTSNGPSMLVHVGAWTLFELALLLLWYGYLHPGIIESTNIAFNGPQKSQVRLQQAATFQHWCYYVAGLLFSLVISWELFAFGQTRFDVLLLAPASYLAVVAPFVMRDKTLSGAHGVGQIAALSGALLLLLPALWFSFSDNNLLPTLILMGESLALLLLGIATRVRIFVLSSAALLLVAALRALFLSTPPYLALMLLGVLLVVIATALFLVRHKLQIAWTQWE